MDGSAIQALVLARILVSVPTLVTLAEEVSSVVVAPLEGSEALEVRLTHVRGMPGVNS